MQPIEGAFLACSFWLADAYVLAGEIAKAQALFDRVVAIANDLGLLAEEYDPRRAAPDRQFPAGADAYRADQHRAQSQRRENSRRKSRRCSGRSRAERLVIPAKRANCDVDCESQCRISK